MMSVFETPCHGAGMIELKSVSKLFRVDVIETYALRDFDLSVRRGEFVAITGHSGCHRDARGIRDGQLHA
jgi:ABC-type bacteriocin/lantibiotic exporter with double-glycine peptidase domain